VGVNERLHDKSGESTPDVWGGVETDDTET